MKILWRVQFDVGTACAPTLLNASFIFSRRLRSSPGTVAPILSKNSDADCVSIFHSSGRAASASRRSSGAISIAFFLSELPRPTGDYGKLG
jgi:hypothetical protein